MSQQEMFGVVRARNSWRNGKLVVDPPTSFEAARSVTPAVNRIQRVVLNTFQLAGRPLTDEELIAAVRRNFGPGPTDSSIRSRRKELERAGRIELRDRKGKSSAGRACSRFQVSEHTGGAAA